MSARTARLIGRENVATSQGAVTELVKNTYDADATVCGIFFLRHYDGIPKVITQSEYESLLALDQGFEKYYLKSDAGYDLAESLNQNDNDALNEMLDDVVDLWVVDNGNGMDESIIENRWMVIGTDYKDTESMSSGGRSMTGAKGIGRFALDRLGRETELISSKGEGKGTVQWLVDWGEFDGQGKNLDDINAVLYAVDVTFEDLLSQKGIGALLPTEAPDFDKSLPAPTFHKGTAICISYLHDNWRDQDSSRLKTTLEALLPPRDRSDFSIFVYDYRNAGAGEWIESLPPEVFDYRMIATVERDGSVEVEIDRNEIDVARISDTFYNLKEMDRPGFRKKDFQSGSYRYRTSLDLLLNSDGRRNAVSEFRLGPFEFVLYFMKRTNPNNENLKKFPQKRFDATKRRRWLDSSGGIRLYRDQFRVRPYGEPSTPNFDWLQLGERSAQDPAGVGSKSGRWRVPPNQVAGTLNITRSENPSLDDQSNREGVANDRAFNEFRRIVVALIREFEKDRNFIYLNFNRAYAIDNPSLDKVETGQRLAAEVLARRRTADKKPGATETEVVTGGTNPRDIQDMAEAIHLISEQSRNKDDEIQVLRGLATLGTVLVSFTHELKQIKANMGARQKRMKNSLNRVVDEQRRAALPQQVDPYDILERWKREDQQVSRWVDFALSSISVAKRRRVSIKWSTYIRSLGSYWTGFLGERKITLTLPSYIDPELEVLAHEIDLDSVFFNLIINSAEVLSRPGHVGSREIKIDIVHATENSVTVQYNDNGPGISPVFSRPSDVFEYGATSKNEEEGGDLGGTGIGMYLVKSVLDECKGSAEILSSIGGPGFAISLQFPRHFTKKGSE